MRRWLSTFVVALCLTAGCAGEGRPEEVQGYTPPPVHAEVALREVQTPTTETIGETRARHTSILRSEGVGRVVELHAGLGSVVRAGQVLVLLDRSSSEGTVDLASAEVAQARAQVRQASRQDSLARRLSDQGGVSAHEAANARDSLAMARAGLAAASARRRMSRQRVDETVLRAPFDGVVTHRLVDLGEYVGPGAPLLRVADSSGLAADVWISPEAALDLEVGREVHFEAHARPDEEFLGRVSRVGRVVDERTRRVAVELELFDPEGRLMPGLLGRFAIALGEPTPVTTISTSSLVERHGEHFVYVVEGERAERRPVSPGAERRGRVIVSSGLEPGEEVISRGVDRVVQGRPVRVVEALATRTPAGPGERR